MEVVRAFADLLIRTIFCALGVINCLKLLRGNGVLPFAALLASDPARVRGQSDSYSVCRESEVCTARRRRLPAAALISTKY